MTEHHTAQVNGTRLHYVTTGEGPAVVLLHGWPETSHEWRHVTDLLASDHQVVVPDLRGFGSSANPPPVTTPPPSPRTWPPWATTSA